VLQRNPDRGERADKETRGDLEFMQPSHIHVGPGNADGARRPDLGLPDVGVHDGHGVFAA
jgi:hypothetical protein